MSKKPGGNKTSPMVVEFQNPASGAGDSSFKIEPVRVSDNRVVHKTTAQISQRRHRQPEKRPGLVSKLQTRLTGRAIGFDDRDPRETEADEMWQRIFRL